LFSQQKERTASSSRKGIKTEREITSYLQAEMKRRRQITTNSLSSSIQQCDKEIREKETDFSVCIADADWSKSLQLLGRVREVRRGEGEEGMDNDAA
jgi:hypothetical protein